MLVDGKVAGAVGVSSGTPDEDVQVAQAGIERARRGKSDPGGELSTSHERPTRYRPGIRSRKGTPFPVVTAYDAPFGRLAEEAGIDVLLCGDSLGMVVLGYPSTTAIGLADMERHAGAVVRGTKRAHVMADAFGSYEASDALAVESAVALIRTGVSSVKMESGARNASRLRAIADAGIPICGHIGVLPQTAALDGGFKRKADRDALLRDMDATVQAGAFCVVLEMVDFEIAGEITDRFGVPTIGIGSGPRCDAQVLVLHDVLGLYNTRRLSRSGSPVRASGARRSSRLCGGRSRGRISARRRAGGGERLGVHGGRGPEGLAPPASAGDWRLAPARQFERLPIALVPILAQRVEEDDRQPVIAVEVRRPRKFAQALDEHGLARFIAETLGVAR